MAGAKALFGALSNLIPKSAYRSRLEPAIEALPQEKMTPEQALGSFKKFPGGVGEDELQFTGIKGILEQGQPVTKTSLLEQVRSNPLEITDVYKGDSPLNPDSTNFNQAAHDLARKKIDEAEAAGDWITAAQMSIRLVERLENQIEMLPKYSQYTLPGGSNYQELLMTLPEKVKELPKGYSVGPLDGHPTAKFTLVGPDGVGSPVMGNTQEEATEFVKKALNKDSNYRSPHYDEPNILAHGRYNTRTIDGDKTLFIEEIQTDWLQAGRDQGFKPDTPSGVPDAPYKSTDKWVGLTFNRMLKQAVDSGHDRIAWTSGQIQADRYDLSKRVGEITYEPNSKQLNVYGKIKNHDDDFSPFISEIVEPENLADFIGKEASERLLASRQAKFTQGGPEGIVEKKHHLIKGKDLEIGGEGMKEFYDKILPKISGKIAKKYNSKVEVSADSLYDANPDLIQGTGRNKIDAIENARDEVRYDGSGSLVPDAGEYKAIQNGDVWEAYFDYDVGKGQQVWSMKITPEMKKAVAGGVALSGAGVAVLPEGSE